MAEFCTNGNFNSDLSGWTNSGGDANWSWSSTWGIANGGSASDYIEGSEYGTPVQYSMYYSVSIANTTNIIAAVMDTWIKIDANGGFTSDVEAEFWLKLESPSAAVTTVANTTLTYTSQQTTDLASGVDVKSTLQSGGTGTWKIWVVCIITNIAPGSSALSDFYTFIDGVSLDIDTAYSTTHTGTLSTSGSLTQTATISNSSTGTLAITGTATSGIASNYDATGTLSISGSLEEAYAMGHTGTGTLAASGLSVSVFNAIATHTGTLTLSGVTLGSQSIRADWEMFLGSGSGKVFTYSDDYLSDDGTAISSIWQSKQTDLSDQKPEMADMWKNLWKIRLIYVDKTADTNVTIYVSTDGGESWTSKMKTLGTGDGTTKSADFYFIKPFEFLDVKIEHSSTANEFQWAGIYAYWTPAGEHFEI